MMRYLHRPDDQDGLVHWFLYTGRYGEGVLDPYAWAYEHFGEPIGPTGLIGPDTRWAREDRYFFFREDDDAFHFRMRWC